MCIALKPPNIQFTAERTPLFWEANKFETKEDTKNVFLFLESTQNDVLDQRVLNKTSLKWRP